MIYGENWQYLGGIFTNIQQNGKNLTESNLRWFSRILVTSGQSILLSVLYFIKITASGTRLTVAALNVASFLLRNMFKTYNKVTQSFATTRTRLTDCR